MAILAGCTLARRPSARYAGTLPFVELALDAPLPGRSALARWRKELPESLVISLVAPRAAVVGTKGVLRRDAAMDAALAWWIAAADALDARALVLPTPADLAPGARDREVLRAYLAALPRGPRRWVVWQPGGVWTPEEATEEAVRADVVLALDPLEDDPVPPPSAYARVGSLGVRDRVTEPMLERIASAYAAHELALVAFRTDHAFAEARRLDAIVGASDPP